MSKRISLFVLSLTCLVISTGCNESVEVKAGKPVVYVPVPPYKEIASRIAGDAFEVRSLVSESDDPHDYSPTPKQVAELSKAAFFFTGEMGFEESLVEKLVAGNSKIKVFNLTDNLTLLEGSCDHPSHNHSDDDDVYVYVVGEDDGEHGHDDEHAHSHGEDEDEVFVYVVGEDDDEHAHEEHGHSHGEDDHAHEEHGHSHGEDDHAHSHGEDDHAHEEHGHSHGEDDHGHAHGEDDDHHHAHEMDPHVWLSPKILKSQAAMIAGILKNAAPDAAGDIDANLAQVVADLEILDNQLAEKLAFMKGETFYVYHGAFAYFAKAYGLNQEAIEVGGRRPEPKRLTELVEKAKKDGVKLIFVQPQFDQSSANSLANAIGGQVMLLDPLAEDVFGNLKLIADTIGQSSVAN